MARRSDYRFCRIPVMLPLFVTVFKQAVSFLPSGIHKCFLANQEHHTMSAHGRFDRTSHNALKVLGSSATFL